ncbi:MAG TPA: oligosaccharide flippase family protein [Candidatus Kapabacteria bacterium]|nr:oligosaccharide flippase family protein [Candidatus Kapabacteria bacterium]
MPNSDFKQTAARGFAWNYLYKISEYGLINLYTILVVRHFGPDVSAPYSVFFALATILSMVGAFAVDGVLLRFIRRVARHSSNTVERFDSIETLSLPHFLNTLLAFRMLVIFVLSIFCVLALIVAPILIPSVRGSLGSLSIYAPYLIVFLFAQALTAFSTFALTGLLELKRVFFASVFSRVLMISAGFALMSAGSITTERAIVIYVLSTSICGILLYIALHREVKRTEHPTEKQKQLSPKAMGAIIWSLIRTPKNIRLLLVTPVLLYGITTWGNDILSMVLGKQSDILIMASMLGDHSAEIGYYQAASIVLLVTEYIFLFGLGGTLVSVFSTLAHQDEEAYHKNSYPSLARGRKEVTGFQNVVLLPLCFFMFFFIDKIIIALYGGKFHPSVLMVRVGLGALFICIAFFGGGVQVTTLVSIGKERLVFRNRLFWGLLNIAVNIVLIYFFGGLGALIGTQYCNAGAVATESYFSSKYVGSHSNYGSMAKITLIAIVSTSVPYFILQTFASGLSPWLAITSGGVISVLIILVLYRVLNIPELAIIRKRMGNLFS